MDLNTKETIKSELNKRVIHIGSGKKAAVELGISNGTISNLLNDKTELISTEMWRKMATALGVNIDEAWSHADTLPFIKLSSFFDNARLHANVFAMVTNPGGGKTHALDYSRGANRNIFYSKSERHTTERDFLKGILTSMRVATTSHRITEMLKLVVDNVKKFESPLIVMDEIEKVKNDVFMLPIDIYNSLEDICGLALIGTPYLETRIKTGVERGTLGYNELYSRIGGKVIKIPAPSHADAALVMRANGITDVAVINKIIASSDNENNEVDLRRVKRLVHAHKQKEAK